MSAKSIDIVAQYADIDPAPFIDFPLLKYKLMKDQAVSDNVKLVKYDLGPQRAFNANIFGANSTNFPVEFELDKFGHTIEKTEIRFSVTQATGGNLTLVPGPMLIDRIETLFNDQLLETRQGIDVLLDLYSLNYDENQVADGIVGGYDPTTFVNSTVLATAATKEYCFEFKNCLSLTKFPYGVRNDKIKVKVYFTAGVFCYETGSASAAGLTMTDVNLRVSALKVPKKGTPEQHESDADANIVP